MEVGHPKEDSRYWVLTEELLAFYCMMSCRFAQMAGNIENEKDTIVFHNNIVHALRHGLNDRLDSGLDLLKVEDLIESMVSKLTFEGSFDNTFWAYWHADLDALRIPQNCLAELVNNGTDMPSQDKTDVACFAVVVRSARYTTTDVNTMPATETIKSCKNIFEEDGGVFNKIINTIFRCQ